MLRGLWHSVCPPGHRDFHLTNTSSSAGLKAQVWAEAERGQQGGKAVSLRRDLAQGGLGQKRLSARVNQTGEIQLVCAGCPIDCAMRDQSCVFLLPVLTSLRDMLHLMFVVSTLSSDPNSFGLTNLCLALSKSSTELEWWPGCSMVLHGAPGARGHAEVPPNPRVT